MVHTGNRGTSRHAWLPRATNVLLKCVCAMQSLLMHASKLWAPGHAQRVMAHTGKAHIPTCSTVGTNVRRIERASVSMNK
eukprot:4036588-Pleurochrysis_carterae.AAC.1